MIREHLHEILYYIKEFFIPLPGIAVATFSLYFAFKKIGNSVSVSYSISADRMTRARINNILLINNKEKTLNIFSIEAIIDEHSVVEIEKFKTPIRLDALSARIVETTAVSNYILNNENYDPDIFNFARTIDLYLITEKKKIKCKIMTDPSLSSFFDFQSYKRITKQANKFNNMIYDERIKYALVYVSNAGINTSFVDNTGFIINGNFHFSSLNLNDIISEQTIKDSFKRNGYPNIMVHKL